jgi:hypothetical protein
MSGIPIIISLAVIRQRLTTLDRVLESLLAQSVPADKIILNLSRDPYLLDEGADFEDLPEMTRRLAAAGKIEVYFTRNIGPYRKLLPTLQRYAKKECFIATADDDVIYPPCWLEGLREAALQGGVVAAYRVRAMRIESGALRAYNDWPIVNVDPVNQHEVQPAARDLLLFPTGRGGVMYRSTFFPDPRAIEQLRQLAPAQDDLVFRFLTMAAGIPVVTVDWRCSGAKEWEFPAATLDGPKLYENVNQNGMNDLSLNRLMQVFAKAGLWRLDDHLLSSGLPQARAS